MQIESRHGRSEWGVAMNQHRLRVVRCSCCGWSSIVPMSLEPEAALELGRGLARLHKENVHGESGLDDDEFDFENFETSAE